MVFEGTIKILSNPMGIEIVVSYDIKIKGSRRSGVRTGVDTRRFDPQERSLMKWRLVFLVGTVLFSFS